MNLQIICMLIFWQGAQSYRHKNLIEFWRSTYADKLICVMFDVGHCDGGGKSSSLSTCHDLFCSESRENFRWL